MLRCLVILFLFPLPLFSATDPIPPTCRALLIAQPESWNSTKATLRLYRRTSPSLPWAWDGQSHAVHLGRNGLAWGRGLQPQQPGPQKREGDGKSPAGLFHLGNILYGYERETDLKGWRYRQVTDRDLWIEDPSSPLYNRHLILSPHEPFPPSEKYHLMRQADPAHALKLFILHNAPPDTQPGAGSAIFFHLCRNPESVTTGCTSMEESGFRQLLGSFTPADQPIYVLLPNAEYLRFQDRWKLP